MIFSESFLVPILGLLSLVSLGLLVYTIILGRRMKKLLRGEARDLEETITALIQETETLQGETRMLAEVLEQEQKRIDKSIRGLGVVRFNAFAHEGNGGNASFATALIDERSSGVLITGLTGRGETRVYVRPLIEGKAPCELMPEEAEAVTLAQKDIA